MVAQRGTTRLRAISAAACVLIGAAACSSSGGDGVSTSKLESKLKNEPAIAKVLDQGGTKAKVTSQLVDCIAKALKKDADQSDLKKYVDGDMNLNDLGGKQKGSANDIKSDAQTCAKSALQKDQSSASKSP